MTTIEDRDVDVDPAAPTTPIDDAADGSSSPFEARSGAVLADKFELERLLGKGGMGTVWVAQHLGLKSQVAIKLIHARIARDELAAERFVREAQSAANLRGRNVVQIFDYGVHQGTPYIAMELLEGESLAQRLRERSSLDAEMTARLLAGVGRAAGRAHELGIVHRDLKPDNIFIVHDGDAEVAKVLDFGIAKTPDAVEGSKLGASTNTGTLLGTPYYMSPEQAKDSKKAGPRSDIWALGVIAYECLVGKRPFSSDQLTDLVLQICTEPLPVPSEHADVPAGFDAWFAKACERSIEERFQTAADAVDALRTALGVVTPSVSMVSPIPRSSTSWSMWVAGVVAAAAVVGVVLFSSEEATLAEPAPQTAVSPPSRPSGISPEPGEVPTEPSRPARPKLPKTVKITFKGPPPGAEVFLGDERLGTTDAPLSVPRGDTSATLRIQAEGHLPRSVVVVPSQDLPVQIELESTPPPAPKRKPKRKPQPEAKAEKPEVKF